MNRRFPLTCAFLLTAFALSLYAQDPLQTQSTSDTVYGQQNSPGLCPDGSSAIIFNDGSTGCQSSPRQQFPDSQNGAPTRPNSVANPGENAPIGGPSREQRNTQNQILPPEPLTEFQKFVAATTGQILHVYGADLFRNVPSTFAPDNLAPVTADYILGPDDELRIRIWGQVNYSGNLRVDRSGNIYLPEAGAVHVAGLQFSTLDQHLRSAISRVYRNFDLTVDMGRIHSMQIYMTGQARRPGAYTISSLSSLVDALFASGGPSAQGSLRHLELRRDGKTIGDFDLYALLMHGDKTNDMRLLPEDVLYIPPAGPQVAIIGSIRTPGIYELRGTESVADLLNASGQTTAMASNARGSIERTGDHQLRQAMEFSLDEKGLATGLINGDIVRVYSIVPAYQNTVMLRGNVANPGRFSWHEGMKLSDLIPDRDSLMSRDYWWKRSHLGLPTPEFEPFLSNLESNLRRPVRTGTYQNLPSNSPGNIGGNPSYPNNAPAGSQYSYPSESYKPDPNSPEAQEALTFGLERSLGDGQQGIEERKDPYSSETSQTRDSQGGNTLASQMNQQSLTPGLSDRTPRTTVRISAPEIDWNYAVIERLDHDTFKTSLIPFDLGKLVLNHDASQDLAVQPGDTVTVFSQHDIRVPIAEQTKYVYLEGEFAHSGIYSVNPGETLRDLVRRAGGFTSAAYLYGSEFDRESTRVLQQQRIDEYVRRVDIEAERGNLALMANPTSSSGTLASATAASAAEQGLINRLRQIRATGRVVLNFRPETASIDDVPLIALENGDRFTVPSHPATVNVVGAVYDQNSFMYRSGGSARHYLTLAGGPDRDADWRHTFVIRADGSVVSRDSVKGPWGNNFKALKLNPGDTIVVPDKTIRPTALRGLLDWTQIFSQLAIGAAAVNVLR